MYIQQISDERLQDHWSSGFMNFLFGMVLNSPRSILIDLFRYHRLAKTYTYMYNIKQNNVIKCYLHTWVHENNQFSIVKLYGLPINTKDDTKKKE